MSGAHLGLPEIAGRPGTDWVAPTG